VEIPAVFCSRKTVGGNSNSTTGDYSMGIIGMYVENGKIIKPVNE